MFAAIFVVLFFLSVMALAAVTVVVIVYRFYKNLLGSEGYLMHTLPVTVHQLIWSKLIAAVVWMAVTSVCIYGCLFRRGVPGAGVGAGVLGTRRAL